MQLVSAFQDPLYEGTQRVVNKRSGVPCRVFNRHLTASSETNDLAAQIGLQGFPCPLRFDSHHANSVLPRHGGAETFR